MKLQKLLEQQSVIAAAIVQERQAQRERKKELVLKLAERIGLFDLDPKQIADALQKAASSIAEPSSVTTDSSVQPTAQMEKDHAEY